MSGSAFAVTHHAFSSGAGRTSDGNGSHASTLKSPSYTKSVSWQHYREEHSGLFPSLPVKNMDQLTANISIKRKLFSGWFYLAGLHNASEIMNYTGRSRCD
ncbi:hypothetical protein MAK20_005203 [Klebsiella pneumoniae]|nr:hypothetical protein [Klebsiella pneumoniae]EKX6687446.1 hypothetical protein [Klebsiella pneumoniae]